MLRASARLRRATTFAAAAATAVTIAFTFSATPSATAAPLIPPPAKPSINVTTNADHVTIQLGDPNTGLAQVATFCTAALIDIAKAVPLLPSLVTGVLPPLNSIDPALFTWGPSLQVTSALQRQRTYDIPGVRPGIYLGLGICVNPDILHPAVEYKPVFVGSKVQQGSAALGLGSSVITTPGALPAVLAILGAGSLSGTGS
ncbi:hypothetical protein [Jongsikchunia kroppenstedtii]|uniref:hypothetical protein n=1 Tax=Jongsikchunia kroppenstedtii TaxID=1121721 RepID=UPI00037BA2FB|nr:hypothetical protein [Jongsikchunia kroppenstedtii]